MESIFVSIEHLRKNHLVWTILQFSSSVYLYKWKPYGPKENRTIIEEGCFGTVKAVMWLLNVSLSLTNDGVEYNPSSLCIMLSSSEKCKMFSLYPREKYYHSHFADNETKAEREELNLPKLTQLGNNRIKIWMEGLVAIIFALFIHLKPYSVIFNVFSMINLWIYTLEIKR